MESYSDLQSTLLQTQYIYPKFSTALESFKMKLNSANIVTSDTIIRNLEKY